MLVVWEDSKPAIPRIFGPQSSKRLRWHGPLSSRQVIETCLEHHGQTMGGQTASSNPYARFQTRG